MVNKKPKRKNMKQDTKVKTSQKHQVKVAIVMIGAAAILAAYIAAGMFLSSRGTTKKTPPTLESKALQHISMNYDVDVKSLKHEQTVYDGDKQFIYFTQEYKGIPVYNSRSVVYVNKGSYDYVKLNHHQIGDLDTSFAMSKNDITNFVKNSFTDLSHLVLFDDNLGLEVSDEMKSYYSHLIPSGYNDIAGNSIKYDFMNFTYEDIEAIEPFSNELVIYPSAGLHRLAYQVDLPVIDELPAQFTFFMDAQTGETLNVVDNILYFDVTGTVTGLEWEDPFTDGVQLEKPFSSNEIYVGGDQYVTTNDSGYYSGSASALLAYLQGPWVDVTNYQTSRSSHSTSIVGNMTHDWNWDNDDTSYLDEESNVFFHANRTHDYAVSVGVNEMDFTMLAKVNKDEYCNAFFTSVDWSINFFKAGNGCESTGVISDVVIHEYGHGIIHKLDPELAVAMNNDIRQAYSIHEAIADYWACTINDNPNQGEGFHVGDPNGLRICNSDFRYPDDFDDNSTHVAGQILSGALWDIREEIGKNVLDPLLVNSLRLLPVTFNEILDSLIIVDDGTYVGEICDGFINHGISSSECAGHSSIPVAMIDLPTGTDLLSGLVDIVGTAYPSLGETITDYTIKVDDSVIGIFTDSVIAGTLMADWDTRLHIDGEVQLSIIVRDSGGVDSEYSTTVEIKSNVIIEPTDHFEYLGLDQEIDFIGNANGLDFDHYILEISKWTNTIPWPPFTVFADSNTPVDNGVLGTLDLSTLAEYGLYRVRFFTYNTNGHQIGSTIMTIYIEDPSSLQHGWPQVLESWGSTHSLIPADITGDNSLEVLFSNFPTQDNVHAGLPNFHAYDYSGNQLPGWPTKPHDLPNFPSTAAVSDINQDGIVEIVTNTMEKIYIFHPDGNVIAYADQIPAQGGYNLTLNPSIGDIDNDEYEEIVVTSGTESKIHVFTHEAEYYPGYPLDLNEESYPGWTRISEIALGDLDFDGNLDAVFTTPVGGLYAMTLRNQEIHSGFPIEIDGIPHSVILGDIDCNGDLELITEIDEGTLDDRIMVWNADGSVQEGWPQNVSWIFEYMMNANTSPTVGNIDNDCNLEVFFTSVSNKTYAWDSDGTLLPGWPVSGNSIMYTQPIIGDIDGDGNNDIIVRTDFDDTNSIFALNADGTMIDGYPKQIIQKAGRQGGSIPALADIDQDGDIELMDHSQDIPEDLELLTMKIWDLDVPYDQAQMEWPMSQHDLFNSSNYNYIPIPVCGNTIKEGDEECDDGNLTNGDGCSSGCVLECGDGVVDGDGSDGYTEACEPPDTLGMNCTDAPQPQSQCIGYYCEVFDPGLNCSPANATHTYLGVRWGDHCYPMFGTTSKQCTEQCDWGAADWNTCSICTAVEHHSLNFYRIGENTCQYYDLNTNVWKDAPFDTFPPSSDPPGTKDNPQQGGGDLPPE